MKTLFAGPFIGEFGWELFGWQSYIRHLSKNYDRTIISSRPGHEALYSDFMDEYISYDPKISNCAGWTCYGHKYRGGIHEQFKPDTHLYIDEDKVGQKFIKNNDQEFFKYGKKTEKYKNIDIVINARYIKSNDEYKKSRNYSQKKWGNISEQLKENGYNLVSIGRPSGSLHIPGTENMIGISLKELSEVLCSAKMIIGPSSGPLHFASLCGCPQFVWTPSFNRVRYEKKWNPFFTPVKVYDAEGWNPDVSNILDEIMKFMEEIMS